MTDQDLLNAMQYHLLEVPNNGASLTTDMWAIAEWIDAINHSQDELLLRTGAVISTYTKVATPQIDLYDLPADFVRAWRVAWQYTDASGNNRIKELHLVDSWQLDYGVPDWPFTYDLPSVALITEVPTLKLKIAKAPSDIGTILLYYIAKGTTLSNSGVAISVPADLGFLIKWGGIAELLSKGEYANDSSRSQYAAQRFKDGIELVNLLLGG